MSATMLAGHGELPGSVQTSDTFEWGGQTYKLSDLKGALSMLLTPDIPKEQLLADSYQDPCEPASWEVLEADACRVMKALPMSQTLAQVLPHTLFVEPFA